MPNTIEQLLPRPPKNPYFSIRDGETIKKNRIECKYQNKFCEARRYVDGSIVYYILFLRSFDPNGIGLKEISPRSDIEVLVNNIRRITFLFMMGKE
jgi:hypothetical protein